MLILTARSHTGDVVVGFETGADDYIAKPFDIAELLARVKSHLRRAAQRPVLNPLTGAPGGVLFAQELRHRIARGGPLALLYADLDNFKAFNDAYGFSRGDRAILLVAGIIQSVLTTHGNLDDFVGHIGGDDFAVLTAPDQVDTLCRSLISTFNREVLQLYHPDDRRRGYLTAADRHGILRRFNLMSISIGVVTTERRSFSDEEEITRVAAEMKQFAKAQAGSSYAVDQRVARQHAFTERRSARHRGVLIVSDDNSLRSVLRSTLQSDSFPVQEVNDVETLRQRLDSDPPALVLADAQLGAPALGALGRTQWYRLLSADRCAGLRRRGGGTGPCSRCGDLPATAAAAGRHRRLRRPYAERACSQPEIATRAVGSDQSMLLVISKTIHHSSLVGAESSAAVLNLRVPRFYTR